MKGEVDSSILSSSTTLYSRTKRRATTNRSERLTREGVEEKPDR
jgi:hypothetical protein